jgi:polyhydroxyalkanoate synthase
VNESELQDVIQHFLRPWKEQFPGFCSAALHTEAHMPPRDFFAGFNAYMQHPYQRDMQEPCVIWQAGSTRLLDYHQQDDDGDYPPLLFIPSLINRSYILDLHPECSIVRYLAAHHIHPYLLDFGEPQASELDFTNGDYITKRVEAAIAAITARTSRPLILAGYCMGGLMALATALRNQQQIQALVLLATPWDFHKTNFAWLGLDSSRQMLSTTAKGMDRIPHQAIQALFYMLNPLKIYQKFSHFAQLSPGSAEVEQFVSVERWVNDGISITLPVAQECVTSWLHHNQPLQGKWQVAGQCIRAEELQIPTLIVIPENDYIVPPLSTEPLITAIPRSAVLRPPAGHVGMVIGHHARTELWQPLLRWLQFVSG